MVLVSLLVPNLLGLFASAESRGIWQATTTMLFGLLVTVVMRDAQRFMERERNWYQMLETILLSPVSRWSHFRACATAGVLYHIVQVLLFSCVFLPFLFLSQSEPIPNGLGPDSWSELLGLALFAGAMFVAIEAMGGLVAFLPFILRPISAFFIVNMVPTLVVALSGIYFPASSLPWGIRHIAYVSPVTYGAVCLDDFFNLDIQLRTPVVDTLQNVLVQSGFPEISYGWLSLLVLTGLNLVYVPAAYFVFVRCELLLRRIGRLRRLNGND